MHKVVYNACYGGFGLSDEAIRRYAEIKGLTLYPEGSHKATSLIGPTYWTIPPEAREGKYLKDGAWDKASQAGRIASNKFYSDNVLQDHRLCRHDPVLVQVVEELGDKASGRFAKLRVASLSGRTYRIDEYDGNESVEEPASVANEWVTI